MASVPNEGDSHPVMAGHVGWLSVVLVIIAVLLPRIALSLVNIDSVDPDILQYRLVAETVLNGQSVLQLPSRSYPYPPVWLFVEAGALLLSRALGLDFSLCIKAFIFAGDLALALMLLQQTKSLPWALFFALNPISIIVSAGQGQFDVLALLPIASGILLLRKERYIAAGLVSGIGIALKFYPIFFVGILTAHLIIEQRRRDVVRFAFRYAAAAIALWLAITIPFCLTEGWGYLIRPISYAGGSLIGDLGIIQILDVLGLPIRGLSNGELPGLLGQVLSRGKVALGFKLLSMVVALGVILRYRMRSSYDVLFTFTLVFYALGGGFSGNYLLWLLPFAVLATRRGSLPFTVFSTFALIAYSMAIYPGWFVPGYVADNPFWVCLWQWTNALFMLFLWGWLFVVLRGFERNQIRQREPFAFGKRPHTNP